MYPPDPDDAIPEKLTEASQRRHRRQRERLAVRFLKGPIPLGWVTRAARLPGKSLHVALAIWFKHGLGEKEVSLTPNLLRQFGVAPRTARRLLEGLEEAGVVQLVKRNGRCPRATVSDKRS